MSVSPFSAVSVASRLSKEPGAIQEVLARARTHIIVAVAISRSQSKPSSLAMRRTPTLSGRGKHREPWSAGA